ncbi:MAG: hypothetical protein PWQ98_1792 [Moorella sp. (in: firmicutes)]|nr:hypothetical protein [Moorella sp. (in: firmicutes)]
MTGKKALRVLALTLALAFMFSAVALAATPSIIFYQNAAGQMVQVDYQKAMDQAAAGNTALLEELKKAILMPRTISEPLRLKTTTARWLIGARP